MIRNVVLLSLFFLCFTIGLHAQPAKYSTKWVVTKPFERNVFIQNKGQFPDYQTSALNDKVLYYTIKGRLKIYYVPDGLIFEYDSIVKLNDRDKQDKASSEADYDAGKKDLSTNRYFVKMQWAGGNAGPEVEVQNPVSDYFTYSNPKDKSGQSGITAHGFGKLIYHNVYKGIDVVFYYPEDKGGLEYDVIVHPGADVSAFKMSYTGATALLAGQGVNIASACGINFTDHSPEGTDGKGNKVPVSFKVSDNTVTFGTGKYDNNTTLTIDPWFTTTAFTGTNKAYDLDYDVNGNVYIYGGGATTEYQVKKYNNAGVLQWTFTGTMPYLYSGSYFYGGMVADERSGTTYICEGFDPSPGDNVIKISTNGVQAAKYLGGSGIDEMWHMAYDYCDNELLYDIGGNGSGYDAAYGDTNMNSVTGVGIFGPGVQDQTLINTDGGKNCYVGSCQMVFPGPWPNYLAKATLPTLSPVPYKVQDMHGFIEITNISYYPIVGGYSGGNGFNGLAANSKIVVTYDGGTARIWRPSNGSLVTTLNPSGTHYAWGGLDLDCKSNIYCGNNNNISVYDSSGNSIGTVPLNNTVYALRWDPRGLVYACGNGFVQAVTAQKMATATKVNPSCSCTGSATANACGVGPFTYSWSNGATTSTITGLCAGTYTVTIKNSACFARQDTAIVVLVNGGGGFTITKAQTDVKCNGGATGSATVTISGGTKPYTYLWTPNGGNGATATGLTAGTYTCTENDATGCTDTTIFTINQPPPLTVPTTVTNVKCNGGSTGSAIVTAGGGTPGYTYSWSPGGGTNASVSNLSVGLYTVIVTDANGCTASATATITQPAALEQIVSFSAASCGNSDGSAADTIKGGTPAYTYLWSNGQTSSNAKALSAGTYKLTVTDANGCTITTSVTVSNSGSESVTIANITNETCAGGSNGSINTNTTGGTTPYTYSWTPSGGTNANASNLSAGTYTISVTDAGGCTATASATITQPVALSLVAAGAQAVCPGDSVGLSSTPSGGDGTYTYNWTPAAGLSCPGCQNPMAAPSVTTIYTVTVTDGCGASDSAFVTVTINPAAVVSFIADTISGCAPICTNFKDMSTMASGNIVAWNWNFGDGNTDNQQSPHHCYTNPGKYTVTLSVTSNNGCTTKLTIPGMINVYNFPVAAFTFRPQPVTILNPTITFGDESKDSYGIASWLWSFGDLSDVTDTMENPVYKYQDTGTYCATLTVTNIHGCRDSVTECLVISPQYTLYIPDAFTPNGDGLNDIFTPRGQYVYNFKMYIFDRWGMMLYSTTDINKGWNGTVNGGGVICQEDTYVYMITCQDNFGKQHSYIGKVTLTSK